MGNKNGRGGVFPSSSCYYWQGNVSFQKWQQSHITVQGRDSSGIKQSAEGTIPLSMVWSDNWSPMTKAVSIVCAKINVWRLERLPSVSGRVPVHLLLVSRRKYNSVKDPSIGGKVPFNRLKEASRYFRQLDKSPSSDGNVPVKSLLSTKIVDIWVSKPSAEGSNPWKPLFDIDSVVKLDSAAISLDRVPVKIFSSRNTSVSKVRLYRLLGRDPVNRLRSSINWFSFFSFMILLGMVLESPLNDKSNISKSSNVHISDGILPCRVLSLSASSIKAGRKWNGDPGSSPIRPKEVRLIWETSFEVQNIPSHSHSTPSPSH